MKDAFLGFLCGIAFVAFLSVTATKFDSDSAPAPEAAPIVDPWPDEPPPAAPSDLPEGVFRWVPGHWEEIEPLRPVKPSKQRQDDETADEWINRRIRERRQERREAEETLQPEPSA